MDIYERCPTLENDRWRIRLVEPTDLDDLWAVYRDKAALPYFNSDNCGGANFYCARREDVENMIRYWLWEYTDNHCFVRFAVVDKAADGGAGKTVGTIECFARAADGDFPACGLLRLDVGSGYETAETLQSILECATGPLCAWFGCDRLATKAPLYAVERIAALRACGYQKLSAYLTGHDGTRYYDYWASPARG